MADKSNDYFVISSDEKTLIHYFDGNGKTGAIPHFISELVYCANLEKNANEKITKEEYIKNLRNNLKK